MSITLRKKLLKDGRQSLYLDHYGEEGRRKEFLKLYLFKRPKDELEKQHNKETLKLAESICSKRELQANSADHGFADPIAKKVNFIEYFEKFTESYPKKDKRIVVACLSKFKAFAGRAYMRHTEVTEQYCLNFKEYLTQHLNGKTPYNYFAKFKKMLRQAKREKLFTENPAEDLRNSKVEGIKKDVLTTQEIQQLARAYCGNTEVKRSFLFATQTGLRFVDVVALKWGNIHNGVLQISQSKTDRPVIINLNSTALKLLGEPGRPVDSVFTLPSHTAVTKNLKAWAAKAGIHKKITFHVARHTMGTQLLLHDVDIKTASSLLGHTNLATTERYVRIADSMKQKAVDKLPEIDLTPSKAS